MMRGTGPDIVTGGLHVVLVAGCVAAALGVLLVLIRGTHRREWMAGMALLVAAQAALLITVLPESLMERWLVVLAGLAAAGAVAWACARPLVGRETWIVAAGAAVAPFRIPVPFGDAAPSLLLPLYLVLGLAVATCLRRHRAESSSPATAGSSAADADVAHAHGPSSEARDAGTGGVWVDRTVAAMLVVLLASATWSRSPDDAATDCALLLVPFAFLYIVLRGWVAADRVRLRGPAAALVAALTVSGSVGIWQWLTGNVWWNEKVIVANRFRADFRTNGLFFDPNIEGRQLVLALMVLVAWWACGRPGRRATAASVVAALVLAAGLWVTYSQSSLVALAAASTVLGVLLLPPRARRAAAALVAVGLVVGTPLALQVLVGSDRTGRGEVARSGLGIATDRVAIGQGLGAFERAYAQRAISRGDERPRLLASHTTPVTVLVEAGAVGALAYLALLAAAVTQALGRWRGEWPAPATAWALAALVALVAHSLLYAGFFEDPLTWAALALIASVAPQASRARPPGQGDRVLRPARDQVADGGGPASLAGFDGSGSDGDSRGTAGSRSPSMGEAIRPSAAPPATPLRTPTPLRPSPATPPTTAPAPVAMAVRSMLGSVGDMP